MMHVLRLDLCLFSGAAVFEGAAGLHFILEISWVQGMSNCSQLSLLCLMIFKHFFSKRLLKTPPFAKGFSANISFWDSDLFIHLVILSVYLYAYCLVKCFHLNIWIQVRTFCIHTSILRVYSLNTQFGSALNIFTNICIELHKIFEQF